MKILESLTEKVQRAAADLIELKKERGMLLAEVEALRQRVREHQTVIRENERMRREQDQLRGRLQRLHKKIEKHLLVETTLAATSTDGGSNEEHS